MRLDPKNPHQRNEFEHELAEQLSLGSTGIHRANELLNEMARSRDGREYLHEDLNAQAFMQGDQVRLSPSDGPTLAHELTHVIQQRQGRVRPRYY